MFFEGGVAMLRRSLFIVALLSVIPCLCLSEVLIGVRTANDHSPFYVAEEFGWYGKEGIPAKVKLVPSNTEIVEGLKRKEFLMGAFPVTTAIAAIAHGVPIKIVAMTGRGSDGLLVRKDSGIRDWGDLRGKRIATIRASILDVLLLYALEQSGLDPKGDVKMSYFMKLGDMISALKTGQVEATSNTEPFMTEAELAGWGRIVGYYTSFWPGHPCCVVVAHQELLREDPKLVEDVLRVHVKAVRWTRENPEGTAEVITKYMRGFSRDVVLKSLSREKMEISYEVNPEEIRRMAGLMKAYGLIEEVPPAEGLLDTSFLRRALSREDQR